MNNWRDRLGTYFEESTKAKQEEERTGIKHFIADVVLPAFREIEKEMRKYGREVVIRETGLSATITVSHLGEEEIQYMMRGRAYPANVLPYVEMRFRERKGLRFLRTEAALRSGPQDYSLSDIKQDEIISHFIENYVRRAKNE